MEKIEDSFIKASRKQLRFTGNGTFAVEDLWKLPLTSLDKMYKSAMTELSTNKEQSLLEKPHPEDEDNNLRVAILTYIVETRQAEKLEKETKIAEDQKKARIKEVIERKKDEKLETMSIEDLEKLL